MVTKQQSWENISQRSGQDKVIILESYASIKTLVCAFIVFVCAGCLQKVTGNCAVQERNGSSGDDTLATGRGNSGQNQRCETVLPSVQAKGRPVFQKILQRANALSAAHQNPETTSQIADNVAFYTKITFNNMMLSSSNPIHPEAFFSTVKDFESSTSLQWSQMSSNSFFKTGNCTSGECFGLFQVDVKLEKKYKNGQICMSDGLNIWNDSGGADFCSSLFWWTSSENGAKCKKITSSGKNPCRDANVAWDTAMINSGRKAYVQRGQWGANSWAEMYENYGKCLESKEGSIKNAISSFQVAVGLKDAGPQKKVTKAEPVVETTATSVSSKNSNCN